jgi:hypothetical protein
VGSSRPPKTRVRRGWARHLEGWEPGLVAILLAGTGALLTVPRSVAPVELPPPFVDPSAIAATIDADEARAEQAEGEPLDLDVRAVGTEVRAFGRADHDEDGVALARAKQRAASAAGKAGVTEEALLRLRAFQQRSFLREVRRWERVGEASDELIELGGGFPRMVAANGWCVGEGRCVVAMDEATRRASFKKRWNEIVGVVAPAFALTLDEQRALLAFLLARPAPPQVMPAPSTPRPDDPASRALADRFRLQKIDELAALDATYPAEFARGVVLFRLGRFPLAVEAFRRHLDRAPDGPLTLRARNHLRAALELASDDVHAE